MNIVVACFGRTQRVAVAGLLLCGCLQIQAVTLSWDPASEPDVVGYKVYYGLLSRNYSTNVNAGNVTSINISNLTAGATYYFAVTARSSTGMESTYSSEIQYVVPSSTNYPPVISSVANLTINEDSSTAALPVLIGDAETPAGSLTLTGLSSDPALVPAANITFGGSGSNRTVRVTPALDRSGSAVITLQVSDGSLVASNSFLLTVTPVNDHPTISSLGDRTINEDTSLGPISFTVGDVETAAGGLTLTGGSSNGPLVPAANIVFGGSGSNRTVKVTPVPNQTGSATISVSVSDGSLSATTSFVLTVTAVNDPPTITSIGNQTLVAGAPPVAIAFIVDDLETPANSLTLSGISSNPGLLLSSNIVFAGSGSNRTVTLFPVPSAVGTSQVTIAVSDGALSSSTAFLFSVSSNISAAVSFTNGLGMTIRDAATANPYPSIISVSGVAGTIARLDVRIEGLSHSWPDDIDMLLVGPTGEKVILLSDTGGNAALTNVTLTLSDTASSPLPDQVRILSGSYKPTNIGSKDTFPAPAPVRPYATNLAIFNGRTPNGDWKLFVVDDGRGDTGSIRSWSLAITPDLSGTTPTNSAPDVTSTAPDAGVTVLQVAPDGCVTLQIDGLASQKYIVEASEDLITWNPIGTILSDVTSNVLIDCPPALVTQRFYRVNEDRNLF